MRLRISQDQNRNETFAYEFNKDELFVGVKKVLRFHDHVGAKMSEEANKQYTSFESSRGFPLSWLAKRTSYFIEDLNKFLMEVEQYGFKEYLYNSKFENIAPTSEPGPQILTMYMLSAGFYIWLGSVVIACIVFAIEHIVALIDNMKNHNNEMPERRR
jgi:hypothetical protein